MKMQNLLISLSVALSALNLAGCATHREAQTGSIPPDAPLWYATNSLPGSTYDIRIYVVQAGDTLVRIARKFGISLAELRVMNPGLNSPRIRVGQQLKVYEKRVE